MNRGRRPSRLDNRYLGLYLLDVSGHGVSAALLSVTLSHWLSSSSNQLGFLDSHAAPSAQAQGLSPVQVVTQLNAQFPMDGASRQFFTISYGVLDTQAQQFRYVSAGHPPLIHLSGGEPKIVKSEGFPVGVVSEPDYGEHVLAYRVCRADDSGVIHRFGIEGK